LWWFEEGGRYAVGRGLVVSETELIDYVEGYMSKATELVAGWRIMPRNPLRYSFDSIALAMISKGFSLSRSCLLLLRSGQIDEAYGLSRSLVEASLILRYLTEDEDARSSKSAAFVGYTMAYKNYWLHWCRKLFSGTTRGLEVELEARKWKLDGNPDPAVSGWVDKKLFTTYKSQHSNHPLDGSLRTSENKSADYATSYFQTSQFVHCSPPSLAGFFPEQGVAFKVAPPQGRYYATMTQTAFILVEYIHLILRYAMYGLGIDDSSKFDLLFRRYCRSSPRPRGHSSMANWWVGT
jgi:uncharacterized protein DUF5677